LVINKFAQFELGLDVLRYICVEGAGGQPLNSVNITTNAALDQYGAHRPLTN